MITIDTLLSGFIGAILAVFYQRYRDKKEKEYLLAKERLEKVYGPLLLIFDAYKDVWTSGKEKFLYNKEEEEQINELILRSYHLIEEKRKPVLLNLYRHRKFSEYAKDEDVINAIKSGYTENSTILLQKSAFSKIKELIKNRR